MVFLKKYDFCQILSCLLILFLLFTILSAEVRPAPHMDNLVSIYKSMEAASGMNIFISQNLSSAKLSGKIVVNMEDTRFHFLTITS